MHKLAVLVSLAFAIAAFPAENSQDTDWKTWGREGVRPTPKADKGSVICKGAPRAGSWWWPDHPEVSDDDATAWGNRGVVFHVCIKTHKENNVVVCEPPPKPETHSAIACSKPVFNNVLFEKGKTVLNPEGQTVIEQFIAVLKEYPEVKVTLEGHTCDLDTEGHNYEIGLRRAEAVKGYMIEHGVDAARISTKSFGESQPAVPNDSDVNRKLNRRVQFVTDFPFTCRVAPVTLDEAAK